jgi:hypothetical protein
MMMNIMILFLIGMDMYVAVMITVKSQRDNRNMSFILTHIILFYSLFFNRNKTTNKHKSYFFRDELHLNQDITTKPLDILLYSDAIDEFTQSMRIFFSIYKNICINNENEKKNCVLHTIVNKHHLHSSDAVVVVVVIEGNNQIVLLLFSLFAS